MRATTVIERRHRRAPAGLALAALAVAALGQAGCLTYAAQASHDDEFSRDTFIKTGLVVNVGVGAVAGAICMVLAPGQDIDSDGVPDSLAKRLIIGTLFGPLGLTILDAAVGGAIWTLHTIRECEPDCE